MAAWTAEHLGDPRGPVLVVCIHGGFWRARYDLAEIARLAHGCAALPCDPVVWNIEYPRVGMPGGGWPGTAVAVSDAVAAALREAAGRPVVLIGHSAGGHLALWAAGEHRVALAISLAGVCDLEAAADAGLGHGAVYEFLGAEPDADLYAAASPIARLPLNVPSLLIHGDADLNVPVEQSRAYHAAAVAAGDPCELHELPGAEHFEPVDPGGRALPIIAARVQALAGYRR